MRGQIIDAIFARMQTDPDIFFLTADMGINLVEKFCFSDIESCLSGIATT